jgi:hypothetical protein
MPFSPSWLAEREPADVAARSSDLCGLVAARLPRNTPVRVVDLGSGTGSNARYLIPFLASAQEWQLVDSDPTLLEHAPLSVEAWSAEAGYRFAREPGHFTVEGPSCRCRITLRRADLNTLVGAPLEGVELVTASALLDLVSESWLDALSDRCAATGATVLFALTYDGRFECVPEDPGDTAVRALVNRHQRTDKGFGPALGPGAVPSAARLFAGRGYEVHRARSDWGLAEGQGRLQQELIDGWASAAVEIEPDQRGAIEAWRERRLRLVEAQRSRLVVGHEDLAAWPLR